MSAPTGAYFHPGQPSPVRERRDLHATGHVHVADPPPFNVGAKRFTNKDLAIPGQDSPGYHAAYPEVLSPTKWSTKGWSTSDDPIKAGRGTSSGKLYSSMAPKSGPPLYGSSLQPLYATYPNETRLQELLNLQRRKHYSGPAPDAYQGKLIDYQPKKSTFRRPAIQALDGPFPLGSAVAKAMGITEMTRLREIASNIRNAGDSGLAPGEYDGLLSKDATSSLRSSPAMTIGTGAREGRTSHAKSLSISRSIQHGIDWHVPVIIQARPKADKHQEASVPGLGGDEHQEEGQQHRPADTGRRSVSPGGSTSPRYMEASPPRTQTAGRPPAPPIAVARTVRKPLSQVPGAWDWQALGFNYRNSWTTLHGGAYTHGDKAHLRRSVTAPYGGGHDDGAPGSAASGEDTLASFNQASSIDISTLPLYNNALFPVPEEPSAVFRDINSGSPAGGAGSLGSTSPPRQPSRGQPGSSGLGTGSAGYMSTTPYTSTLQSPNAHGPGSPLFPRIVSPGTAGASTGLPRLAGPAMAAGAVPHTADLQQQQQGGPSAPLSPRLAGGAPLPTQKDLARHAEAYQAASEAAHMTARRNEWAARSAPAAAPLPDTGGQVPGAVVLMQARTTPPVSAGKA